MRNRIIFNVICLFFYSVSSKVNAQYDDVYFDPNETNHTVIEENKITQDKEDNISYSSSNYNGLTTESATSPNASDAPYDDESLDDEDYDYYYSSRIKRFHQHYYSNDFYDPFYSDILYYDPYYFDPFFQRDIYAYSNPYRDYVRYRRWNYWYGYNSWNYWNTWNWWNGYNPYGPVWSYNYYYNPWLYNYYGGWNSPWNGYGWGGRCGWYNHSRYSNWNDGYSDTHNPKGRIFGSRKIGITHTSKNGPVRYENPSNRNNRNPEEKAFTPNFPKSERSSLDPNRVNKNKKDELSPITPEKNPRGRKLDPERQDQPIFPGKRPNRENNIHNPESGSSPKKEALPTNPRKSSGVEENKSFNPRESSPTINRKHTEMSESSVYPEGNFERNKAKLRSSERIENDQYYSPTENKRIAKMDELNNSSPIDNKEKRFKSLSENNLDNPYKREQTSFQKSIRIDRSNSSNFEKNSNTERSNPSRIESSSPRSSGSRFSGPNSSGFGSSGHNSSGHNSSGHSFSGPRR